ncbi:MAG: carbohydrate-binding family 9-like protein [Clostridia bacterium]|nr:carbohydrate-binding family 9-like protein [Clostridia bacterium]
MRYKAGKTDVINPDIHSAEWEKAEWAELTDTGWVKVDTPINTKFKLLRGPEGISVMMHTDEKNLRAEVTEENGMVCKDSCMEFFFKPDPWNLKYINFEINPKGVAHIGLGEDRYDRQLIDEDRATFSIESIPNDGDWTLKYYIPDEFLHKYFETINYVCRANVYKCADATDHKHYTVWAPVEVARPDYHVPDFFGFIEL